MNAAEVMDSNPPTLKPTDTIEYAVQFITTHRYRNLPVVDVEGHYLGMFGVNCMLKQVIPKAVMMQQGLKNISFIQESVNDLYLRYLRVKDNPILDCLSVEPVTVSPDTPLLETLLILHESRTSLPVVEMITGKLLGLVSYWDIGRKMLMIGEAVDV